MENVAVILCDVPFFVEIQLEDDAVIGLAQIVYRKERPDNVCYPGSEELRVIFVPCNEVASPFIAISILVLVVKAMDWYLAVLSQMSLSFATKAQV